MAHGNESGAANLPAVPDPGEVEDAVDGVVVNEGKAVNNPQRPVYVLQVINVVVQHPAPRAAARHTAYIAAGLVVAARRRRRARTLAGEMAQLEAARGNPKEARDWAELDHKHRMERARQQSDHWEKRLKRLVMIPSVVAGITIGLGAVSALLIVTGNGASAAEPWRLLAQLIRALVTAWRIGWELLPALLPAAVLAWLGRLYYLGRTAGELAPSWARTSAGADADITIDERTVTKAIADMRFPQVRDYLKAGHPLQFLVPCRQEGRGTYFEVRLPGIPAEKVIRRRAALAGGLYRLPKETWPSVGSDAAVLKAWVADKGALEDGAGPYPLLADGFTDVFKGLPFGRSLRGDPVKIPVIGRNSICGGAPEQGKSNGARVVACGYTLDVTTELRLYIPDTNFDFERFKPRASSYEMGAEDEHVEKILGELEQLKDELQARGQLLIDREQEEVTYALAHAGIGLHPVFVLLEEAHVVIQHRKHGKSFQLLLPELVKLDRKRGVHIMVSTQAPTKDSMPRDVTRNCTVGIAYAVGDHVANDALLGQGAYAGGHRATELIPGTDRGTALCKGFAGEARSEMVQAYRVSGRRGDDQVSPVVARAMAELGRQGLPVPGTGRPAAALAARDLLADLGEVIRSPERLLVRDAVGMLRDHAPGWGPYRTLTATQLREQLLGQGVKTVNSSGTHYLDPADLRAVLAHRAAGE